ncbi:LTA synthase family protein [Paenibacillus spiritus]|uniref:LTA synthase family protein n=1 Tax=Paenibacillus spiritus TaxID=2496557 RepID=A0A5J5FZX7_9BACL|nr:LTA synthase family protein [Paenibacillus spiritus]KAA8999653.1 LTA synthase family protein [Paenibacillus spiritus]
MKKRLLYLIPPVLFIAVFGYGRTLLYSQKNLDASLSGLALPFLKDAFAGLLVLALLYAAGKLLRVLPYLLAVVIGVFHLANVEYIYALDHVININDIKMASDAEFIKGTLFHVSFPLYTTLLAVTLLASVFCLNRLPGIARRARYRTAAFAGVLLLYAVVAVNSGGDWKTGNFMSASISNSVALMTFNADNLTDYPPDIEQKIDTSQKLEDGEYLLENHTGGKNVLMVVMEGIPGAYSPFNQELLGVKNDIRMDSLEKIKNHSLVVPNYITHNNQTIRGMYSLISGDYPKLDASTPKAYEYLQQDPATRAALLPQLLKDRGYATEFIQAANLDYMSKGDFMTAAGFDTVIGGESFKNAYVPFGWGPDDKAFFEQSRTHLDELNAKGKPWFAAMLTVGTHHPYAVTDSYAADYPSRKAAAVAYLDEALSDFIDYINASEWGKNTLVLFVSDESHGVNDQPYGSNWGIFAAYSPDIQGQVVNEGVYGQKDVLNSVLDYADPSLDTALTGRSLFRDYSGESPILFASHYNGDVFYSVKKGEVYQVDNSGQLYQLTTDNGEMFGNDYTKTSMKDSELKKSILTYKNYIDKSSSGDKSIVVTRNKDMTLKHAVTNFITDGQFLSLPAKSYVTISFEYDASSIGPDDRLTVEFQDYTTHDIKDVITPENRTGVLKYRFYNEHAVSGFSFRMTSLFQASDAADTAKSLKVKAIIVDYAKADASPAPSGSPAPSASAEPVSVKVHELDTDEKK